MGCSYSEALACSCLMGSTKCDVAGEPAGEGSVSMGSAALAKACSEGGKRWPGRAFLAKGWPGEGHPGLASTHAGFLVWRADRPAEAAAVVPSSTGPHALVLLSARHHPRPCCLMPVLPTSSTHEQLQHAQAAAFALTQECPFGHLTGCSFTATGRSKSRGAADPCEWCPSPTTPSAHHRSEPCCLNARPAHH